MKRVAAVCLLLLAQTSLAATAPVAPHWRLPLACWARAQRLWSPPA